MGLSCLPNLPTMPARLRTLDIDAGVEKRALFDDGGALAKLIGRSTTPFQTTFTEFVRNLQASGK